MIFFLISNGFEIQCILCRQKILLFKKHEMQMFKIMQSAYFDSMSVPMDDDADI